MLAHLPNLPVRWIAAKTVESAVSSRLSDLYMYKVVFLHLEVIDHVN